MTIQERLTSPTPKFFKKVRNIGLILAAISATLFTAPVALPAVVVHIAGYLGVGAAVATAVSQAVTSDKTDEADGK